MRMKKIISLLLAVLSVFTVLCPSVYAGAAVTEASGNESTENEKIIPTDYAIPEDESITVACRNALLYSEYDKRYLFSKNADELLEPASTVKIMVGIMIFEKFGDRLDTPVTVTDKLLEGKEGLVLYIEEGEILTIRQLLTVLLMYGANDASVILAHYYMRDEKSGEDELEAFADLMTKRAAEIGCKNTVYKNVTGLHSKGVKTVLQDIIKMASHAANIPGFTEMTSTEKYVLESGGNAKSRPIHSRNNLISSSQTAQYKTNGVTGMNYGSTEETGQCLLVSAEYDGKRYFAILMGGYTDTDGTQVVYRDAKTLLNHARTGFKYFDVLKKGVTQTQVAVRFSMSTDVVTLVPEKTVSMYLPAGTNTEKEISFKIIVKDEVLDAPVEQGFAAGDIVVVYNEQEVCRVPLVTNVSVQQSRILYVLDRLENFVKKPVVIASFISFFVFLIIFIIVKALIEGQKKKRKYIK